MIFILRNPGDADGGGGDYSAQAFDKPDIEEVPGVNAPYPIIPKLLQILGNFSQIARPGGGEDAYGAELRRQYERNFMMEVQRNTAINNQLTNFFGLNPRNPLVQGAGLLFGDPGGGYGRTLQALTGSNPMLTGSMLYQQLGGATMGGFGQIGHISANQAYQMTADLLNTNFYHQRKVDDTWRNGARQNILDSTNAFASANPSIAGLYSPMAGGGYKLNVGDRDLDQLQLAVRAVQKAGDNTADAQKAADQYAANLQGTFGKIIQEYKNKNNGVLAPGAFQEIQNKIFNNPLATSAVDLAGIPALGSTVSAGVNYAISRGYSTQQMASMFTHAGALKLLGNRTPGEAWNMAGNEDNFNRVMSAFRPIGKAMGVSEPEALNQLIGSEAPDLLSTTGADKMEKLGRDVMAVTRVAGIGIKNLIGMIKTMQDLASQHPELSYMGSNLTQMTLDSVKAATAIHASLTPAQDRALGGVQGIANREASAALAAVSSPIGELVGNSLYLAKLHGVNIQASVDKYVNSPQNGGDVSTFINQLALPRNQGGLGLNRNVISQLITNPGLTAYATSDSAITAQAQDAFRKSTIAQINANLGGMGNFAGIQKAFNSGGMDEVNKYLTDTGIAFQNLGDYLTPGTSNNSALLNVLARGVPKAASAFDIVNSSVAKTSADEANYDRNYAQNYGAPLSTIINNALSGSGNSADALAALRQAYISPSLSPTEKAAREARYGAFATFSAQTQQGGGATAQNAAALFAKLGIGGAGFAGSKDQAGIMQRLYQKFFTGQSASQIIQDIKNGNDEGLKNLYNTSPGIFTQDIIDSVANGNGNFNPFIQAAKGALTSDSWQGRASDDILSHLSGLTGGAAALGTALQTKLKDPTTWKTIQSGGMKIDDVIKSLGGSAGDSTALMTALNNGGNIDDRLSKYAQDNSDAMSSDSTGANDPMSQIATLLSSFMGNGGSGGGSFAASMDALTTAIGTLPK